MNLFSINFILRFGLAFTFLYAGIASVREPADWVGFVPVWVENFGIERDFALQLHAYGDIALGLWLLSGFKGFYAGLVAASWLGGIIAISGIRLLPITFRDVGLALSSVAYALYSQGGKKQ